MAEFEENNNLEAAEIDDDELEAVSGGVTFGEVAGLGWAIAAGKVRGFWPGEECPNSDCNHQILEPYSNSGSGGETICPNCKMTWSWHYI